MKTLAAVKNIFEVTSAVDTFKKNVPAFLKKQLVPAQQEWINNLSQTHDLLTVGRGYFYTNGCTAEAYAKEITQVLSQTPGALVVQSGKYHHSFVGGAETLTAKASFFWAIVAVKKGSDLNYANH